MDQLKAAGLPRNPLTMFKPKEYTDEEYAKAGVDILEDDEENEEDEDERTRYGPSRRYFSEATDLEKTKQHEATGYFDDDEDIPDTQKFVSGDQWDFKMPKPLDDVLMVHQREAVKFLFESVAKFGRGAQLYHHMGLGKTLTALALVSVLEHVFTEKRNTLHTR